MEILVLVYQVQTLCAAATSVSLSVSCGALASMAMAGPLGPMRVASSPTTSTSVIVPSTRQTAAVVGTPFLSAVWLIKVYVAKNLKAKLRKFSNFVRSGIVYIHIGKLAYCGNSGPTWSTWPHNGGIYSYRLNFNNSSVYSSDVNDRFYGSSLRCLAN